MTTLRPALLCATALTGLGGAARRAANPGRTGAIGTLLALSLALMPGPLHANPEGGVVVGGQAVISAPDSSTVRIDQGSANAIINWQRFDIGTGEAVQIHQPSASSALLNRVTGSQEASRLLGRLTANGQVMLVNPNGVMIGRDAVIDVAALVATTADIPDAAFMAGSRAFTIPGNPDAAVTSAGAITAREGGLVALVAPGVENSGLISARLGRVVLASGDTVTLDFYGDGLVEVAADAAALREVVDADGRPLVAGVDNRGFVQADGGHVWLSAAAGSRVLDTAINVQGLVQADTVAQQQGEIVLSASGAGGIDITGTLSARGTEAGAAGGRIRAAGTRVIQRGPIDVGGGPEGRGGEVALAASGFVAVGNRITADGGTGGTVTLSGGRLSSAGVVNAAGTAGAGGSIDIAVSGTILEPHGAALDASGTTDGGTIRVVAGRQVTTSGSHRADGGSGRGGRIDLTAPAVKLLSPRLSAAGGAGGGVLRIGGEFQGGKGLAVDELPNARTLVATDATSLNAAATGASGDGGTAILWSDSETVFLGEIDVRPGSEAGAGGLAEISSAGLLTWRGRVATGQAGRNGQVLLDPKNITIALPTYSQYSLILGYNYSDLLPQEQVTALDAFGTSVSLDGQRLVVGAPGDDGADDATSGAGAAYLFYFEDTAFNGGTLVGVIGKGYSGGNNLDVSQLEASDEFGTGVSVDGLNLVVGAPGDDASGNGTTDAGAVYTFAFSSPALTAGSLTGRLGSGYSGTNDLDLSAVLDAGDYFGQSVSLSGTAIAVGAPGDDGSIDAMADGGAVYGFTSSSGLASPVQQAVIGHGYAGGKNFDVTGIGSGDMFGYGVSLDGTRMVAGAIGDDGFASGTSDAGAAYLFTFSDTAFSSVSQIGTIGEGYLSVGDVDIDLDAGDLFGKAVGLGTLQLLAGAPGDDASDNLTADAGAVYRFTFSDNAFATGAGAGIAGKGYAGGSDIGLTLDASAAFGRGIGVDGSRWAGGLPGDKGSSNPVTGAGAVILFSGFSGSSKVGTIGRNYWGTYDIDVSRQPAQADAFGSAVSLNNLQLAVGAPGDDGAGDPGSVGNAGAVYLFTFADTSFNGGALKGVMGSGYIGSGNFDVTALAASDNFGAAVSVTGTGLAVGAPGDDGVGDATSNSGAVYLFTFADTAFGSAAQKYILQADGGGALPGSDALDSADALGSAVALSASGLAVGAPGDDGDANGSSGSGAVRLYSAAAGLTGVTLIGKLGVGYSGGSNIDVAGLEAGDGFGAAVSLQDTRLAVGAPTAPTATNTGSDVGAVHLFTFADASLASGSQAGIIGSGDYSAYGQTLNMAILGNGDKFGSAVAISDDDLAVGVPYDDGSSNTVTDSGAVYLFDFTGLAFGSPILRARFGKGYSGGSNLDVAVESGDLFGAAVALNSDRLAVGASNDDGSGNGATGAGAVYLFNTGNGTIGTQLFSTNAAGSVTLSSLALADLLSTPQTVILQASNDITLSEGITVDNTGGNGGSLYLVAGRSVLLNRSITTDNGDLYIRANAPASDGVVDAQRDAGAATVTMQDGYSIDAGTGSVQIEVGTGAGNTNSTSGDISLATISAGNLMVANKGLTAGSDILNAGSTPTITASTAAFSATGQVGSQSQTLGLYVGNLDIASGGEVGVTSYQAVTIGGATLGSLSGLSAAGTLSLTVQGQLSQTEPVSVAGAATVSVTGGPLLLDHSGNDFQGALTASNTSGTVTIADQNALSIGGLTIGGTLTVTAGGAITQGASSLYINAPASFTTTAGGITLTTAGNYFGTTLSLSTAAGGDIAVGSNSAIVLGAVDSGGSLSLSGSGAVTLNQDVTAMGSISLPNGVTVAGGLDVVSETGGIAVGAVSHGSNNILLAADTMSLDGNWSGTGTRTIKPYSANRNVAIAHGTTVPDALELTAAEIARLEGDSPSMVTIGRSDGSSALTSGTWSFNDNLSLAGGSIALSSSTLTKSAGSLTLTATGAVTGAVNLAAGTGTLTIQADSVALTGTVNGVTGSQAAMYTSFTGTGGSGPFTMNGTAFHTVTPSNPTTPADDTTPTPGDDTADDEAQDDTGGGSAGDDVADDVVTPVEDIAAGDDTVTDVGDAVGVPVEDAVAGADGTGDSGQTGSATTATSAKQAAAGFDAAEGEALETSAQISTSLDQNLASAQTTADLTLAALDTSTGLSGGDAEAEGEGGSSGSSSSRGSGSGALKDEQPYDEQDNGDEEAAAGEGEQQDDEQGEDEEEPQPRRQSNGYSSNRYVELVDVDDAAQNMDADDGVAGAGAGCSC
ncbi:MAG: filamentous hemagglutinin N-terminal domain-containing protein [Sneathiellaceae bacterium]